MIREASETDANILAMLVSRSNKDVAEQFGLTEDNCSKHPSFCMLEWILSDLHRGERYFLLEQEGAPIACVAFEPAKPGWAYLNRLSVLPERRKKGVGAHLVQYIIQLAKTADVTTISIGVIGEHKELIQWYKKLGFVSGDIREFPHLPFTVQYMTYAV